MDSTKRGARLGKYGLVAELSRGGMGIVYLATVTGPHRFRKLVVVKQLKPELAEDEKFREMFLDEARLAARLNHRNIVQTTEVDQEGDRYFFVMEYLEGRTLHAVGRLKNERALPIAAHLRIVCEVLAGLHYAHELSDYDGTPLKIVHRDVGPRNVFITYDGQVKLLDFGVAKAAGREHETEAGELKGRVPYMAPEQLTDKALDRRADVFSAGVLVREAVTGLRLWEKSTEIEILRDLMQKKLPPLPNVEIHPEIREILAKAMAPNAEDRYRTAHEMRAALELHISRIDPGGSFGLIGEHVSREFAKERAQVQAMIEEHIATAESTPPARGELPALTLGTDVGSSPSGRNPRSSSPTISASASTPTSAVTPPPAARPIPTPKPTPAAPVPSPPPTPKPVVEGLPTVKPPPPGAELVVPTRKKPSILRYVLSGIGFVALVVLLTLAIRSSDNPTPTAPRLTKEQQEQGTNPMPTGRRPDPVVVVLKEAGPNEDPDLVEVTVNAIPFTAQVWIDDISVGQGPHTAKYKTGRKHTIRASAPGYLTKIETVTFTATSSVNIVLEREAGR
jgi:eukaryotic-like serine/threonine-protein kinase